MVQLRVRTSRVAWDRSRDALGLGLRGEVQALVGGAGDIAAGQLRDALSRAGPFEAEIATLKRLAGDNADVVAAIASIENMAAKGVPSRVALASISGMWRRCVGARYPFTPQ